MEFLYLLAGFIIAYVIIKIFSKKKNTKSFIKIQESEDGSKYITWTKALNLIEDQIFVINKNKTVIFANTSAKNQFGSKIVANHYASIIRDANFIEAINNIFENKKNSSVNSEINFPTYQFLKANLYYIEENLFDENFTIMVVLQDLTDLLKIEKLKSDFVANVSHELRTPLQSIKLGLETITDGPAKSDNAAKQKFLNIMKNETNRMDQLITDLLTLSKIEQEEHKRPNDKVNVKDIINIVISNLETLSQNKKIKISNLISSDKIVLGDHNKLIEVFYNIIENAIKYSDENKEISVHAEIKDDFVEIKIIDQGYGIPKTSLGRVTERFFRVDPEKSKKIGGTGLGLAIVKHLINQHRGQLNIRSELDKGSEFEIKLPTAN
ncbi:signal transduction histidine kinase [alpha proteobacterium HIMB114]|nr:signal transduction histidine kinase [alpha proteobacterium HIMB114]